LIAADETDGIHWRVGYNNFYVITRYNHSALYAMAVYELAAALKQRILLNDAPSFAAPSSAGTSTVAPATMVPATPVGAPGGNAPAASTQQPALQR